MNRVEDLFKGRFTRQQITTAAGWGLVGLAGIAALKVYFNGGTCHLHKDLTGKVIVITGGNSGLGKEAARGLAKQGATIIIATSDLEKSAAVAKEIKEETKNNNIDFLRLDLADLRSIEKFVEQFKIHYNRLDILINNAGVAGLPDREVTKDGFEYTFGVNFLGHFYLTNLLLDVIKASAPSRIINVSSSVHEPATINWNDLQFEQNYGPVISYAQSKLLNVVFTRELQNRLNKEEANVKVVALNPGPVRTDVYRYYLQNIFRRLIVIIGSPFFWLYYKDEKQGAQTHLYLAQEDHDLLMDGCYYSDCAHREMNPIAKQPETGERVWRIAEELLAQKKH